MAGEQDDKISDSMLATLRTMDYTAFQGEFMSRGNAVRPTNGQLS